MQARSPAEPQPHGHASIKASEKKSSSKSKTKSAKSANEKNPATTTTAPKTQLSTGSQPGSSDDGKPLVKSSGASKPDASKTLAEAALPVPQEGSGAGSTTQTTIQGLATDVDILLTLNKNGGNQSMDIDPSMADPVPQQQSTPVPLAAPPPSQPSAAPPPPFHPNMPPMPECHVATAYYAPPPILQLDQGQHPPQAAAGAGAQNAYNTAVEVVVQRLQATDTLLKDTLDIISSAGFKSRMGQETGSRENLITQLGVTLKSMLRLSYRLIIMDIMIIAQRLWDARGQQVAQCFGSDVSSAVQRIVEAQIAVTNQVDQAFQLGHFDDPPQPGTLRDLHQEYQDKQMHLDLPGLEAWHKWEEPKFVSWRLTRFLHYLRLMGEHSTLARMAWDVYKPKPVRPAASRKQATGTPSVTSDDQEPKRQRRESQDSPVRRKDRPRDRSMERHIPRRQGSSSRRNDKSFGRDTEHRSSRRQTSPSQHRGGPSARNESQPYRAALLVPQLRPQGRQPTLDGPLDDYVRQSKSSCDCLRCDSFCPCVRAHKYCSDRCRCQACANRV